VGEGCGGQLAQRGSDVPGWEPVLYRAQDVPAGTGKGQPCGVLVVLGLDAGRQLIDPDGQKVGPEGGPLGRLACPRRYSRSAEFCAPETGGSPVSQAAGVPCLRWQRL
jgi:hypothetical protein